MELFNTTKKLSLALIGLSYLCTAHATDVITIATDVIKGATDVIKVNGNDCSRTFSESGKIFVLVQNMECNVGDGDFALRFSGDHNLFLLQDHSITAQASSEPARGISITGNHNHVIGPGTVTGFGTNNSTDGNIVIENAESNHVSILTLNEGVNGVLIISNQSGEQEQAEANYISYNLINNPDVFGIFIRGVDGGSAQLNHIYHNSIQAANAGIFVIGDVGGNANANHIYENIILEVDSTGISLQGLPGGSSADANHVHDNIIKDAGGIGIVLTGFGFGAATTSQNKIVSNHIIGSEQAIVITAGGGIVADNLISNNFAKDTVSTPVYCDSTGVNTNDWQTNFDDLTPVIGFPGLC